MSLPQRNGTSPAQYVWLPVLLMISVLVLRILTHQGVVPAHLGNLSPLMALAFAGSVVFLRPMPWWSWAAILLGIDWILMGSQWWVSAHGRAEVLLAYACYAGAAWWGSRMRERAAVLEVLVGTLVCSVAFYLLTNSLSWWIEPYYAKTGEGWVQALTLGVQGKGYPSTLVFFRNSLVADMLGAACLLLAYNGEALVRRLQVMPLLGRSRSDAAASA